jgi:hypothetical protein
LIARRLGNRVDKNIRVEKCIHSDRPICRS